MDIRGKNIRKEYSGKEVLSDFNFVCRDKKVTCIMGPSGSGKTTLIRILMGLEMMQSGEIEGLEGRKISAVFQEDRLISNMTAIKNITLVTGRKNIEDINQAFERVFLKGEEKTKVCKLSGGMKRRVALLRALLSDCDTIIMDEPLKGLDSNLKEKMLVYIKEMTKDKTLIMVTHDIQEAEMLEADIINVSLAISS